MSGPLALSVASQALSDVVAVLATDPGLEAAGPFAGMLADLILAHPDLLVVAFHSVRRRVLGDHYVHVELSLAPSPWLIRLATALQGAAEAAEFASILTDGRAIVAQAKP